MTDSNDTHDLFGSFRAEWLRDDIYRLFSEPAYFNHLLGNKSCVLMGGRGSGKTTVLKCLSYEGQEALGKYDLTSPSFVGIYYKINTNVVTAFFGPDLNPTEWRRLFGHFFNLTICEELTKYLSWHQKKYRGDSLSNFSFTTVCQALGLEETSHLDQILEKITEASTLLELYINNLGCDRPKISQLQSPVKHLLNELKKVPGHEETVFHIILDEYENLLDYQQKIVNTLIKHSGDNCYFKIGVRELGWRVRVTLNDTETLISPADYELIHIEEKLKHDFDLFSQTVCESRLKSNRTEINQYLSLDLLLPTLTTLQEAELLGINRRVSELRDEITKQFPDSSSIDSLHDFELFVFHQLNREDLDQTKIDIQEYINQQSSAKDKFWNHAYAILFSVSEKGTPITKYYCGHQTFARIAHRNIRFYMQLVHESIVQQKSVEKSLSEPIDCKDQTIAARRVGLNYIRELEGVTARGSYLSKLILGFGRYFQILASNPIGGSPECNQFHLSEVNESDSTEKREEAKKLLTDAIMHLALVRSSGTKLATESDTHAWDYSPHPIFAPFFNYSTRRKRKIRISDTDLISMSKGSQPTIKKLLGKSRQYLVDDVLPEQMSIFDEYYKAVPALPTTSQDLFEKD